MMKSMIVSLALSSLLCVSALADPPKDPTGPTPPCSEILQDGSIARGQCEKSMISTQPAGEQKPDQKKVPGQKVADPSGGRKEKDASQQVADQSGGRVGEQPTQQVADQEGPRVENPDLLAGEPFRTELLEDLVGGPWI
jgi:hypothetical protein